MIYGGFAQIYDKFMDMRYAAWVEYIRAIWRRFGLSPNMVLDLACGTGGLTAILNWQGYEMIGVDASAEMLTIARQKDEGILFLQQDMRSFELYGTVDAIICCCDGINYLLDEEGLRSTFALCANYLNPKGLLVFDINTEHKFSKVLADNIFADTCDDSAYIWENTYHEDEKINEYAISCFVREGEVYRRFDEVHLQKAHSPREIEAALARAGFEVVGQYHELTFDAPRHDSQRVFFVCRVFDEKNNFGG